MARHRPMTRWTFNAGRQELKSPAGLIISVREIAQMLMDQRENRYDFTSEWSGWKMRRQFLIPPFTGRNGPKLTPENARRFAEWVREPVKSVTENGSGSGARPQLYVVK